MGEASPGWRSTTLDTDPVAERTHTALEDWFAKAAIFAATSASRPLADVSYCVHTLAD